MYSASICSCATINWIQNLLNIIKLYKLSSDWLLKKSYVQRNNSKIENRKICEVSDTPNYTEFAVNTRNVVPYVVDKHRLIN